MSSTIIRTLQLYYRYGNDADTLSNINLQVNRGDIYGFLGPNGSGKTTTLSLLLGLLKNQRGTIEIFGKNLQDNRQHIFGQSGIAY
jgi:ABC-type multidrug transport system ATPase subunit